MSRLKAEEMNHSLLRFASLREFEEARIARPGRGVHPTVESLRVSEFRV